MRTANSKIGLILGLMMVLIFLAGCEVSPPVQQEYDKNLGSRPGDDDYPYDSYQTKRRNLFARSKLSEMINHDDSSLKEMFAGEEGQALLEDLGTNSELTYTIFTPKPKEDDNTAFPVVLFLHGNGGGLPAPYKAWIDHIVKKGHIVIYPQYQNTLNEPNLDDLDENATPEQRQEIEDSSKRIRSHYLISAICAAKLALNDLNISSNRYDQLNFALIGHSLGGSFAAYVAAAYAEVGLPKPDVLLLADPTDANLASNSMPIQANLPAAVPKYSENGTFEGAEIYQKIPESTLFLSIFAGNYTTEAMYDWAKEVFTQSTQVTNKNMIVMRSDTYHATTRQYREDKSLWLLANHFAVNAFEGGFGKDALDYNGYWKLFDGLCMAAFDKNEDAKAYALWDGTGTPPFKQTSMGEWKTIDADGTSSTSPATPLLIVAPNSGKDLPENLHDDFYILDAIEENSLDDITAANIQTQVELENCLWRWMWDKGTWPEDSKSTEFLSYCMDNLGK